MAKKKNGLDKWFAQKWVDIGSKKKDGSFAKCGRSKQKADAKRKYPKCVPLAKARSMTESQRRSAVKRKRAVAQGVGGKPTNVKTFAKRAKAMQRWWFYGKESIICLEKDFRLRFGEPKQYYGNVPDGRQALADGGRARDKQCHQKLKRISDQQSLEQG